MCRPHEGGRRTLSQLRSSLSNLRIRSGRLEPRCNCGLRRRGARPYDILVLAGPSIKILRGRPKGSHLLNGDLESSCSVAPALGVRGMRGDPAPLAQPYLVPTRDWGVVVDTASVPETNLADSRLLLKLRENVKAEPSSHLRSKRSALTLSSPSLGPGPGTGLCSSILDHLLYPYP